VVFLELSVHHGTFGPVRQFSLGEAALEVGRELLCDCCAGDFHKSKLHFLVPQIDGKFLVSGYQFAIVIIELLPEKRSSLRGINFLAISRVAACSPGNILEVSAPAARQFLPSAKFSLVLFAVCQAAASGGSF